MGSGAEAQTRPGPDVALDARWELVRSLGAAVITAPHASAPLFDALGLPTPSGAQHTEVFVLSAPPHAAIHLGAEGKLGGEGLDRVAGFWRALGLRAPEDADHLGVLLMLYAELAQAESTAADERRSAQMRRARAALFHEHIWSWAPGYLAAVDSLGVPSVSAWAQVTAQLLREEHDELDPPALLPLALRAAPRCLEPSDSFDDVLDSLTAPIRSGAVLTPRDLALGAGRAGVGLRRGERRYALRAMLEQDATGTLEWLAAHARSCAELHAAGSTRAGDTCDWWARRARGTADVLSSMCTREPVH